MKLLRLIFPGIFHQPDVLLAVVVVYKALSNIISRTFPPTRRIPSENQQKKSTVEMVSTRRDKRSRKFTNFFPDSTVCSFEATEVGLHRPHVREERVRAKMPGAFQQTPTNIKVIVLQRKLHGLHDFVRLHTSNIEHLEPVTRHSPRHDG